MKRFDRKFGEEFVSKLPTCPGVYRVFNEVGTIVYVGKAKNLRRRLSQYRNAKRVKAHRKMRKIVEDAATIEWEVFTTDLEACLHEAKLIQDLRPRWNVAGAFAFLYPLVGLQLHPKQTSFVLTTVPEHFPDFVFYGSYRSRFITGEAFFSLMKLISFVGHSIPRKKMGPRTEVKRSYLFGFRQLPAEWSLAWEKFFRGESDEILELLFLRLLENAGARKKATDIQEGIDNLHRFWKHEASKLAKAIRETAYAEYPVPQKERDLLFLRYRNRLK